MICVSALLAAWEHLKDALDRFPSWSCHFSFYLGFAITWAVDTTRPDSVRNMSRPGESCCHEATQVQTVRTAKRQALAIGHVAAAKSLLLRVPMVVDILL